MDGVRFQYKERTQCRLTSRVDDLIARNVSQSLADGDLRFRIEWFIRGRKYSVSTRFAAISSNDDPQDAGAPSCGTLSPAEKLVPVNGVADRRPLAG